MIEDLSGFTMKVKMDGEERVLTAAEVVAGFQKNAVASERLRMAGVKQKELAEKESDLLQREAALSAVVPPSSDAEQALQQVLEELVEEGDIGSAKDKLAQILKETGRHAVTTRADVVQRQLDPAEITVNPMFEDFLETHPEFAPVEVNGTLVDSKARQLGDVIFIRDYDPLITAGKLGYREALEQTAADVAKILSPAVELQQLSRNEEALARKEKIDNLPVASARASLTSDDAEDESPAAIIASMRKARGLG